MGNREGDTGNRKTSLNTGQHSHFPIYWGVFSLFLVLDVRQPQSFSALYER